MNLPSKRLIFALLAGVLFFISLAVWTYSGQKSLYMLVRSDVEVKGRVDLLSDHQSSPIYSAVFTCKNKLYQTHQFILPTQVDVPNRFSLAFETVPGKNISIAYLLVKKKGHLPVEVDISKLAISKAARVSVMNEIVIMPSQQLTTVDGAINKEKFRFDWLLLLGYFLLSAIVGLVVFYSWYSFHNYSIRLFPATMALALALVMGLAFASAIKAEFNASPDERDHFMAAEYFKTRTQIPAKFGETALYTYNSLWNYSRVSHKGIHYILAGKFSSFFDHHVEAYQGVRLFGILMLGVLLFLLIRFPGKSLVLLPLLLTPQAWYLFSYVNDDAFPLFLSFLLILLTEAFRKHLCDQKWTSKKWFSVVVLGLVLGLLLFPKRNYWVFILFYLFYLLVFQLSFRIGFNKSVKQVLAWGRVPALILLVAISVAGFRMLTIEKKGNEPFRENTLKFYEYAAEQRANLFAKGISGKERFGSYPKMMEKWLPTTLQSTVGVYRYMKVKAGNLYYRLALVLHVLIFVGILLIAFCKRNREIWFWIVISTLFFLLMIFVSSYFFSYNYGYQAQGRYIFPALPVFGLALYRIGRLNRLSFLMPLFVSIYFISLYSFIFVGYLSF